MITEMLTGAIDFLKSIIFPPAVESTPLVEKLVSVSPASESVAVAIPVVDSNKPQPVTSLDFEKCGRYRMCPDGIEIHVDLDTRVFLLSGNDIDFVLDGGSCNLILYGTKKRVGSAKVSTSGRALNIAIAPYYYTTPIKSLLPVIDGRNRKGPLFLTAADDKV